MAPKSATSRKGDTKAVPLVSILEVTFPVFSDAAIIADKEPTEKFEDASSVVLPPETEPFLDVWKRPEELVLNNPSIPMVKMMKAFAEGAVVAKAEKGAPPPPPVREFEGKLFAGHKSFEWLYQVFVALMSVRHKLPPGDFMWELIYPKDKDGTVLKSPSGRYKVRLFIMDAWRIVTIDDRIPVDLFGQFLLVGMRPLQLWPLLLTKALLKVVHAQRIISMTLPHQAAVFQMLTGWPSEDLLDPLSGTQLDGGFLFDRLQDVARNLDKVENGQRNNVSTACIIKRALPERPPPRIIVLAGPSAVGRSKVLAKLLADFPDKFGLTVSHTTRRPKEHEVNGKDYFFSTKANFMSEAAAGKFLEYSPVLGHKGSYLYGSSYDTVREVAATGRVCLMSLDVQAVQALQANKRIDGLYLFINPPSTQELESRMRGRLMEAESTVARRVLWAQTETEAAEKSELYDHIVDDTEFDEVYLALKEAISTLSPIIRNRLRGLPAYVLDYSDLIPPNLVEKPFLKPVLISGPSTWERKVLIEHLVEEFPDVFAIPQKTTTRPPNVEHLYCVSEEEEAELSAKRAELGLPANPINGSRGANGLPGGAAGGSNAPAEAADDDVSAEPKESMYPADVHVDNADFDELMRKATSDPEWLVEHRTDLFVHSKGMYRTGVTLDAIRKVIKSGRLPIMDIEGSSVSIMKENKIDFLSIFIRPTSIEEFQARLSTWLTESDEDIAERMRLAKLQMELAESGQVYDNVLLNDSIEDCYTEIRGLVSRYRPDIIMPEADRLEAEAAAAAAEEHGSDRKPILALFGPAGAGRELMSAALAGAFATKFASPPCITDRKPAKGEAPTESLQFVAAKEFAKLGTDGGLVYQCPCEGGNLAVTVAAVEEIMAKGMIAVLDMGSLDAAVLPGMQASAATLGLVPVFVSSAAILGDADAANAAAEVAKAAGQYDFIFTEDSKSNLVFAHIVALSGLLPDILSPPFRPIVVAGPFGTGKRLLLQRLFTEAPDKFAVPPVLTTRPPDPTGVDQRAEMVVISYDEAAAELKAKNFLTQGSALNHVYGVTYSAVKQIQASGKVCMVECDHVADMQKMRDSGFDALYLYMGVDDEKELANRLTTEIKSNPPLGYEIDEACVRFLDQAKADIAAARSSTWTPPQQVAEEGCEQAPAGPLPLVDAWIDNGADSEAAFTRLSEALHQYYPEVIPLHFVWGYGHALWDSSIRQYGQHTLKAMVLGPAGVGKTTVCEQLAQRYNVPHINAGDLIYEEVRLKTPLGLEAKVFMDASKTVPDHIFITLLTAHLKKPHSMVYGWLLDGFPHTAGQARELQDLGIIPDKVIFLDAPHCLLLDRTIWRRMDYDTGKTYHIPEAGSNAMSEAIKPLDKDGNLDTEIFQRLHPRHDDSIENVKARLKLSDLHGPALCASYEDVSLRVSGVGKIDTMVSAISDFLTLESRMPGIEVVESSSLREIQYEIVDVLRYKRRQLLRLQQDDKKLFWVDTKELVTNSHCLQVARNIQLYTESHKLRRVDLGAINKQALFMLESPEPSTILVSLSLGMQYALDDSPSMGRSVLVVTGPAATGKTTALQMLMSDHPDKLVAVVALSTRPRYKGEAEMPPFCFVDDATLSKEQSLGGLVGVATHGGASYALRLKELEAAWEAGLLPVVESPLELAVALHAEEQAPAISTTCIYLTADVGTLDIRMRTVGKLEEVAIQAELVVAAAEMAQVAAEMAQVSADAASEPQPSSVDHCLSSLVPPLQVYHSIKEVASTLWKRSRPAMPCQLLLEEFSWTAHRPGPTRQRLRTWMANAGTIQLPRGRHLLRVAASSEYLHSVWFLSNTKCTAEEYTKVLPQFEAESPGLVAKAYEGETVELQPHCAGLHFRYNFKVAQKTTLGVHLAIMGHEQHASSRLVLVDNASKVESVQPMSRLAAMEIEPNGDKGYCLLSLARVPAGRREPLPNASWALTLTSSIAPSSFDPVSVARSQVMEGRYESNSKLMLCRSLIVPMSITQLAVIATTDPPVPFKLRLLKAVTGVEVLWGEDYPTVLDQHAPDGSATIYNAVLPAGKYVLHLELDTTCCEEGLQPKAVTGELSKPINWRVVFLPSTDDKTCPILADDSRQRHLRAMMESWSAAATAGVVAPPKGGPPKVGAAPGLSARAAAAAAMLEKFSEDLASVAQASPPPPPPTRTLKDGTALTLAPATRLVMLHGTEASSKLLTKEELAVRQDKQQGAADQGAELMKAISTGLDSHKTHRGTLAAQKASIFAEWRNKVQLTAQSTRKQRADAIKAAKVSSETPMPAS